MKVIHKQDNQYVLKLDRGDELMEKMKEFCAAEKIAGGFFVGIGASSYLKLASYNLETKKYEEKEFTQTMEIANITGNVSMLADQMIIHVHGSFSDRTLASVAGHVMKLVIGGACEIKFDKLNTALQREYEADTGLNLLK